MRPTRLLALLAATLIALGLVAGAPGAARADNTAVAVAKKDGSSVFRFAFAIRHVMGDVVDESNAAVAFSSCNDCRATAIAIEIVLVEGDPSVVTPTNVAIAINQNCTLCQSFAAAYQFVVSTDGPVHFTADALRELMRIRLAIRQLGKEELTAAELKARLDPLIARLKDVLATGLVSGPPPKDEDDGEDASNAGETVPEGGEGTTSTGPEATATETGQGTTTQSEPTATDPAQTEPGTTTVPETTTTTP